MNNLKTYFQDVGRHPVLKRPVLMGLFKELEETDDGTKQEALKKKIMVSNLRLVVAEEKKWRRPNAPFEDIIQEGNIGLMRAIEKFDWKRGFAFSTYARWWIQQAMRRYVSSTVRVVRLPAHILAAVSKARALCEENTTLSSAGPSIEEVSKRLNMSHNLARATLAATKATVSLNADADWGSDGGNSRGSLQNRIASEAPGADEGIFKEEMRGLIREVMGRLSEKEEKILRLRFGITENPHDHSHWPITPEKLAELEAAQKKEAG